MAEILEKRRIKGLGWIPDIPDHRDLYAYVDVAQLPPRVDLRDKCPPVYDQGELGSCTANAIGGAIEFDLLKQGKESFTPSRLFIYYNERVIEGTVNEDSGAMLRDGIKVVNKKGACHETLWPYDVDNFTDKPNKKSYTDALLHQALKYARVTRALKSMKGVLASGFPFVFGFAVYESFENDEVAKTGIVPYPDKDENMIGGHAVLAVGYNDANERFIIRNSWSDKWGDKGYFYMPYKYMANPDLTDDLWSIKLMEG